MKPQAIFVLNNEVGLYPVSVKNRNINTIILLSLFVKIPYRIPFKAIFAFWVYFNLWYNWIA